MMTQTIGGNMNQSFHYLLMINQALFQKNLGRSLQHQLKLLQSKLEKAVIKLNAIYD